MSNSVAQRSSKTVRPQRRTRRDKRPRRPLNLLVIDVGGTNVKVLGTGESEPRKIPSGPTMTAQQMVHEVKRAVDGRRYDGISIGYPGPVRNGRPLAEPKNLGGGWVKADFQKMFDAPVKMINDAAMQALGGYDGGRMLFLGLGTGLGSALITDGLLVPMELAHLRYRKGRTYEDFVGLRGLKQYGKKKWRRYVLDVMTTLRDALQVDDVVLGGGNAKKLTTLPKWARLGDNGHAFIGGFRLWDDMWQDERATCMVQRGRAKS